ncbi:MAG TPA: O-antigen polymerase [Longimicrobium sp.]|nr:O-antigen polymerase [Longimicrobium sp.]
MILVLTICFVLAHLLPRMAVAALTAGRRRERDLFSPLRVLTFLALLSVPYLLLLSGNIELMSAEVRRSPLVPDLTGAIAAWVAVACAGFLALALGLHAPAGGWLARRLPVLHGRQFTAARCRRAALLMGGTGVALYAVFLHQIGGLRRLWTFMALRTDVLAGRGYLFNAYTLLLTFTPLLLVYALRFRPSRIRTAAVVLAVAAVCAILASTGGRGGAVTLIVYSMMTAHYGVRRFRRVVKPWTVLLGAVIFVFIVAMPLFRTEGAFERYSARPSLLLRATRDEVGRISHQLSGLDRGVVIVSYFTPDRLWWGSSYLDLLSAPIPRALLPDKPPVDDGVYVTALALGNEVRPSLPARLLPPTSWPPGNWVLYMNFGLPGYLLGMFLTGVAIGVAYRYMRRCDFSPFSVYLYGYSVMGGVSFSNYNLIQMAVTVAVAVLVFVPLFRTWLPALRVHRPVLAGTA